MSEGSRSKCASLPNPGALCVCISIYSEAVHMQVEGPDGGDAILQWQEDAAALCSPLLFFCFMGPSGKLSLKMEIPCSLLKENLLNYLL